MYSLSISFFLFFFVFFFLFFFHVLPESPSRTAPLVIRLRCTYRFSFRVENKFCRQTGEPEILVSCGLLACLGWLIFVARAGERLDKSSWFRFFSFFFFPRGKRIDFRETVKYRPCTNVGRSQIFDFRRKIRWILPLRERRILEWSVVVRQSFSTCMLVEKCRKNRE